MGFRGSVVMMSLWMKSKNYELERRTLMILESPFRMIYRKVCLADGYHEGVELCDGGVRWILEVEVELGDESLDEAFVEYFVLVDSAVEQLDQRFD
jgi:hypothetical protein